MNARRVITVLVHLSRFSLAALFLFAFGAKLYMRTNPQESFFSNMPSLVGARWAIPVALGIIAAEFTTAVLLLWPQTARVGGALAATMLLGFAGYALYYRYGLGNAEGLECGCFGGIIGSQLGVKTALRNLLLLIPAVIVFFGARQIRQPQKATSSTEEISV